MSKIQLPKNIGQGTPVLVDKNVQYFDYSYSPVNLPIGIFFTNTYGVIPCTIHINKTYTEELIHFLRKKGKLIADSTTVENVTPKQMTVSSFRDDFELEEPDYKGNFIYKDSVINFYRVASKKYNKTNVPPLFCITVYYKPGDEPPLKDFDKYLYEEKVNSVIHTIFRDENGGIVFEPFEVVVPENYNVEQYYNSDFKPIHEHIVGTLKKNDSGLYLFHGEPGTGKTTYIKYLSTLIERDIIYVPVAFIDSLTDPAFLPALLRKRHCVLVIEDAEKALLAREVGDSSSLVSAILNITDGIMGNVFNISIIATYNSSRQDIDKALLRKGRLKGEYKFDKLSVKQSQQLLDTYKIDVKAVEPMSLAEIFNTDTPDEAVKLSHEEDKRMGFR